MLSYFLLLLLLLVAAASASAADELAALRQLSAAVGGRTLLWNFSSPSPCSFSGVRCYPTGAVSEIRLPAADLSGEIPDEALGNLTGLLVLSLRRNSLSGRIPSGLPPGLESLFLQDNKFSGEIPASLFSISSLKRMVLSGNRISGGISPELNRLGQLQTLYLQNNDLSGSIPPLDNLTNLRTFNVSYNNITGSIPLILQKFNSDSFINTSMCGRPLSPCDRGRESGNSLSAGAIAGIVVGSVIGLMLILVVLFILCRRYRKSSSSMRTQPRADTSSAATSAMPEPEPITEQKFSKSLENGGKTVTDHGDDGLVFFNKGDSRFGLEELLRASAEVLGKGTVGSSYRAYLAGGEEVVVKRLRNVCVGESEFRARLEGFGRLRHENLVGVNGYYFGKEEKLVVYESLPLGSLANLLYVSASTPGYTRAEMTPLTWEERIRIAYGAARGICYLHSKGAIFSHGNIKSSNILLTDSYTARVSEFCINQLVTNTSTVSRSGYCAPEVTDIRAVSHKADVYSFGVVLLELVTGKAPDVSGVDLPRWVQSMTKCHGITSASDTEERTASVFDDELVRNENEKTDEMVRVLDLGMECTLIHPDKRPSMNEVARRIEELSGGR